MAVRLKQPWSFFWGQIVSPAQSRFVQFFNVSEFACHLCTKAARLPPVPKAGETALSHLIPGAVFHLPLRGKLQNLIQNPAANGSGLGSCLLLWLSEINSKAFNITFWGKAWNWQILQIFAEILYSLWYFKNTSLSLFLWTRIEE